MKTKSNKESQSIEVRYVDIKTVSRYTSLAENTLYEWAGQGKIPSIKIGRRVLFDLHDIDEVMASLKRTTNKADKIVNKIIGDFNGN